MSEKCVNKKVDKEKRKVIPSIHFLFPHNNLRRANTNLYSSQSVSKYAHEELNSRRRGGGDELRSSLIAVELLMKKMKKKRNQMHP